MPYVAPAPLFHCKDFFFFFFAASHVVFDWWSNLLENHTDRRARTTTHTHTPPKRQPGGVLEGLFCTGWSKCLWTGSVSDTLTGRLVLKQNLLNVSFTVWYLLQRWEKLSFFRLPFFLSFFFTHSEKSLNVVVAIVCIYFALNGIMIVANKVPQSPLSYWGGCRSLNDGYLKTAFIYRQ